MSHWFIKLLTEFSVAHDILILAAVIALGLAIGQIKIGGIRLGVAGVLFSGLLLGHFHLTVSHENMHFIKEFGLVLFVYSVGMHVGPGFFSSLKKSGLTLNILAALIVGLGVLITVGLIYFADIPVAAAVGLFSGGTTNTPSLGAAQETLKIVAEGTGDIQKLPGMAYAMAYPFGVMGIILTMVIVKFLFRISPQDEAVEYSEEQEAVTPKIATVDLIVENANLDDVVLKDIPLLFQDDIIVSRVMHNDEVYVATAKTKLYLGDIIHVVAPSNKIQQIKFLVGSFSAINVLADVPSDLVIKYLVVTRKDRVGMTINELQMSGIEDVTITRIARAGVEFTANPNIALQFGDQLRVVGEKAVIDRIALMVGNSHKELNVPQMMPFFIGILLGIIVGSVPFFLPNVPIPVKLGLAGGPLLVAIILSWIGSIGKLIWYIPESANHMTREFGITLFLACVGLGSGDKFVSTLLNGEGLYWMLCASLITFLPLIITGFIARKFLKLNYLVICGVLSGSMTDPPALAFANSQAESTATAVSYATVYPLVMFLRVVSAQLLVIFFFH